MDIIKSELCDMGELCYGEILDSLSVMLEQDAKAYKVEDYMKRRRRVGGGMSSVFPDCNECVDTYFRGKMVEWSYRLCDHFAMRRDIVSLSFSFLDRFVDQIECDRAGYKLAAMTSMFIAAKMMNVKGFNVGTLVTLCREEYQVNHFLQMERIMLSALKFRLNPPVVQAFISYLCKFIPKLDDASESEISSRAVFYGELSVYDYRFVPMAKCHVAVACIMNAILDCEYDCAISQVLQTAFLSTLYMEAGIKYDIRILRSVQDRLWQLFSCSAESRFDGTKQVSKYIANDNSNRLDSSPICVMDLASADVSQHDLMPVCSFFIRI
jgi:Cyclin, N-terminal domain